MSLINFFKTKYNQTNNLLNQLSLMFIIIGVGMIMLNSINRNNTASNPSTDNTFKCTLTNTYENALSVEDLKTSLTISLINYDTDVFKTNLKKNSIPALFKPKFNNYEDSSKCLDNNELAIVVVKDESVLVFPVKILRYHIAVNTYIKDLPILVTYSPLSDHYEVFSRNYKSTILEFGVSGALYKNTDLLYDVPSESLWSQFNGKSLIGNYTGATLEKLSYKLLTIGNIKNIYKDFKVLSFDTGYMRNYNLNTFDTYTSDSTIVGTINNPQSSFGNKDIVLGFNIDNNQYALLESSITDNISYYKESGLNIEISKNEGEYHINKVTSKGKVQIKDYTTIYAFVWYDFFPQTKKISIVK